MHQFNLHSALHAFSPTIQTMQLLPIRVSADVWDVSWFWHIGKSVIIYLPYLLFQLHFPIEFPLLTQPHIKLERGACCILTFICTHIKTLRLTLLSLYQALWNMGTGGLIYLTYWSVLKHGFDFFYFVWSFSPWLGSAKLMLIFFFFFDFFSFLE